MVRRVAVRHARQFLVTNFRYPDGDFVTVYSEATLHGYRYTDIGETLSKLSRDDKHGTSDRVLSVVSAICSDFGIEIENDQLVFNYGPDTVGKNLLNYCQAIVQISGLDYLSQQRRQSTFPDQLDQLIHASVEPNRKVERNWTFDNYDPHRVYAVDYRMDGRGAPVNLFCVSSVVKSTLVAATANFLAAHNDDAKTMIVVDPQLALGPKNTERLQLSAQQIRFGINGNEDAIRDFALAG